MSETAVATMPLLSGTEVDLVRRTVAAGATDDELKLFLYDCRRQGVHPLDKMIHFSKRGGKYTPITSIDHMRSRADDTGAYAGSDDPTYDQPEESDKQIRWAKVTVWKLVQGQRCPFTCTARWNEYAPSGSEGFMWRKMPRLMLGKCAEALALRKAFPKQLHGIYERAEMDQAGREDRDGRDDTGGEGEKPRSSRNSPVRMPESSPQADRGSEQLPEHQRTSITSDGEIVTESESLFPDPEKDELIAQCKQLITIGLASKKITPKNVREFKKTYLGAEDADATQCDKAALADLRTYLESRFGG